jgi:asparagine synthase (glutamine-hydrolysing)
MQAIPHTQRARVGETRSLLRRSLKNVLPEKILKRRSKGNPREIISRAIGREWPRLQNLFNDSRVCANGFIDNDALKSTAESFRHGCEIPVPVLLKALVLEVWLRALERSAFTKQGAVAGESHTSPETTVQLRTSSASAG